MNKEDGLFEQSVDDAGDEAPSNTLQSNPVQDVELIRNDQIVTERPSDLRIRVHLKALKKKRQKKESSKRRK